MRDLNLQIRDADIRQDPALELRDARNLLLDELSQYMKIDVTYSMEDAGAGLMLEKMTVSLGTGDKHTLVEGEYAHSSPSTIRIIIMISFFLLCRMKMARQ